VGVKDQDRKRDFGVTPTFVWFFLGA